MKKQYKMKKKQWNRFIGNNYRLAHLIRTCRLNCSTMWGGGGSNWFDTEVRCRRFIEESGKVPIIFTRRLHCQVQLFHALRGDWPCLMVIQCSSEFNYLSNLLALCLLFLSRYLNKRLKPVLVFIKWFGRKNLVSALSPIFLGARD